MLSPEDKHTLYRFFSGDLPLFACERWISLSQHADLQPARQALQALPDQRYEALISALGPLLDTQAHFDWQLGIWLDWIAREEPRAGLAVAHCYLLWCAGLSELAAVARPYLAGEAHEPFDWNAVRELVPEVAEAARELLAQISSGRLQLRPPADWLADA
ncbi:MAG: hypothetical protein IGS03_05070 [Candidatus Sericytochromatia bacterium]|nr:hypothetical protein [Candidatus Sericytochromatia bacterium]